MEKKSFIFCSFVWMRDALVTQRGNEQKSFPKGRPADTETDWKSQFINGEKIMSFITEFTKAE